MSACAPGKEPRRSRRQSEGGERPAIVVIDGSAEPAALREVLAGVEEEGVPFQIEPGSGRDSAAAMAYLAASRSALGVGIGLDHERVCVHVARFPRESPLLEVREASASALRTLGHNAARVVKVSSLKSTSAATAAESITQEDSNE